MYSSSNTVSVSYEGEWDGQAYSMHERDETCIWNFGYKAWREDV